MLSFIRLINHRCLAWFPKSREETKLAADLLCPAPSLVREEGKVWIELGRLVVCRLFGTFSHSWIHDLDNELGKIRLRSERVS